MEFRELKTERDYDNALAAIDVHFAGVVEPQMSDELYILTLMAHDYEEKHYAIESVGAVAIVKYIMEQNGYKRRDLAALLGGPSRASEFLAGKRALSVNQIRALHTSWHIPADCLLEMSAEFA